MHPNRQIDFQKNNWQAGALTRRNPWWLGLAMPLAIGVAVWGLFRGPEVAITEVPTATEMPAPVPAVAEAAPTGQQVDLVVRRADTLERIFRRLKLNLEDLATILVLPGAQQALTRLRPGDKVTVVHSDGAVQSLIRRISETEVLQIARDAAGFSAEVINTPVDVRPDYAEGTIDSSLFVAGRAAGLTPETTLRLANDIFGWEIDFALDIRPGDRFKVVYEQKHRNGRHIGDGRILAAEFINDGKTYRAVHYASADGAIDNYFAPDGRSMRQKFLRAPLDFTRVSSNFNPNRRHPLLNRIRAHKGVDYAAPNGTLIKAAGDGRVQFIGNKGGYGRVVVLEHGGGISTLYAHMSRFAGLRQGQRVQQGQAIGYVGASGAATGPHLHYEYRVHGAHKNPRTVKLPDAAPLPAQYRADFALKSQALVAQLEQGANTVAALDASAP